MVTQVRSVTNPIERDQAIKSCIRLFAVFDEFILRTLSGRRARTSAS
jgi:hypothetical protein